MEAEEYLNKNQMFGNGFIPHFRVKELMVGFAKLYHKEQLRLQNVIPCGDCSKQTAPCRSINCKWDNRPL